MNVAPRMIHVFLAPLLMLLAVLAPLSVLANDHGGGGGPEPMIFTVNLGTENYLQFGLILETATPEAAHSLVSYKPRIQHEIILLLCGKEAGKLRTLDGKKELIAELGKLVNHVIHENETTGIKEVLFTKFLIQ